MEMPTNLAEKLTQALPPLAAGLLRRATTAAAEHGYRVYLVGGAVRDILLGRSGFDLDLSVEGDAIELAKALATSDEQVTVHHRFNTARLLLNGYHLDLARSRAETYARPGALPTVRPGLIRADLIRRDFSINAMAISLNADDCGELIDLHHGQDDLNAGLIRVLHPHSFIDDATRLWRAVRYEQRLGFTLEAETLKLFQRDRGMITAITPDRQRYELECALGEPEPEKALQRADSLGLLKLWHPVFQGDAWLAAAFQQARLLFGEPSPLLYLALLCWRLTPQQKEALAKTLRLTRKQYRVLAESTVIGEGLPLLNSIQAAPSRLTALLAGLDTTVLQAALATPLPDRARRNIQEFISVWAQVAPQLTGDELQAMGVPRGPEIGRLLEEIRDRRLDGRITSRTEEADFVVSRLAFLAQPGEDSINRL
jgi:tRNA nucleotidyltransferase (CCA-adding enzyme)